MDKADTTAPGRDGMDRERRLDGEPESATPVAVGRRGFAGRLGLVALATATVAAPGCLSSPPGATGPRTPPTGGARPTATADGGAASLRVGPLEFAEDDDGGLVVSGTVVNEGSSARSATVVVAVTVDGEETTRETAVSVEAGSETAFSVAFESVTLDEFDRGADLSVNLTPTS
jgi:hypothetical protein